MVRLEAAKVNEGHISFRFQFHDGTIRSADV